jgi:amidase
LVGLKPSRGWVPVGPHFDELAGGFNCDHVLTRTVRDSALMLDLTVGPELSSRQPLMRPQESFRRALERPTGRLRIGLALETPKGDAPDAEVGAAVEEIAALLSRAGHTIKPFVYPMEADIGEAAAVIWMTAIAEEIEFHAARVGRRPHPSELEALTRASLEVGQRATALEYVGARRAMSRATREMARAFQAFDVLLLPTTATLPPRIGEIDGRTSAFDLTQWNAQSYRFAPYTELFNVTGQPAMSLPLGRSSGLPVGVQIVAPLGEDARLLLLAAWFERERPWAAQQEAVRRRWLSADAGTESGI